jgi:hypothetical protein
MHAGVQDLDVITVDVISVALRLGEAGDDAGIVYSPSRSAWVRTDTSCAPARPTVP